MNRQRRGTSRPCPDPPGRELHRKCGRTSGGRSGCVVGGIATVAGGIGEDMRVRLPGQHKARREGLALLTATMLDVRSANLMDLAASLPRAAERLDMRYQWISGSWATSGSRSRR